MVSPSDNGKLEKLLKDLGISSAVKIDNVQKLIDQEAEAVRKTSRRIEQGKKIDHMEWDQYYTFEEIIEYIDYLTGTWNFSKII